MAVEDEQEVEDEDGEDGDGDGDGEGEEDLNQRRSEGLLPVDERSESVERGRG